MDKEIGITSELSLEELSDITDKQRKDTDGDSNHTPSTAASLVDLKPDLDRPWYYIDKHFILDKCSYMIQEMRFACHLPFLFSIFTSFGLSQSQAGVISGIRLLGSIFGNLFWGFIADKTKKHRMILLFQVVCSILLFCSQPFVSLIYGNPVVNKCPTTSNSRSLKNFTLSNSSTPNINSSTQDSLPKSLKTNILDFDQNFKVPVGNSNAYYIRNRSRISPESNLTKDNIQEMNNDMDTGDTSKLFWILLFINVGVTFFDGFLPSMLDTGVMHKINKTPYRTEFGTQRKFGTLGYAAGVVITNSIIDVAPRMGISCYSLNFAIYSVFIVLEALCIYLLYNKKLADLAIDEASPELVPVTNKPTNRQYLKTIFKTCARLSSVIFFVTVFIAGMQLASKAFFIVTYLNEKNAPSLLFNLFFIISSTSVFFGLELSGKIIETLGGTWNVLAVVFFCYSLKFFGLVILPNVWSLVVTEILDFVCQGCAIPTAILHVNSISTDANRTTMFGFVNSLQFGFGFIFANVVGGFVYEYYGGVTFYSIQAAISLAWAVVLMLYCFYLKLKDRRVIKSGSDEMQVNA